jgi:hypothetical protein
MDDFRQISVRNFEFDRRNIGQFTFFGERIPARPEYRVDFAPNPPVRGR